MITDTPTDALSDLSEKLSALRGDLENTQRELEASLQAWRSALVSEKRDLQALYDAKQSEWDAREKDWQDQRAAYDQKIAALDTHFKAQLGTTEQNALRALNDLDDSWQRDKLQWNQGVAERLREMESRQQAWTLERERQEAFINELQQQITVFNETVVARLSDSEAEKQVLEAERETTQAAITAAIEQTKLEALHDLALLDNELRYSHELAIKDQVRYQETLRAAEEKSARERGALLEKLSTLERSLNALPAVQAQAVAAAAQDVRDAWDRERMEWAAKETAWSAERQKKLAAFTLVEQQYITHNNTERKAWDAERETLQKQVSDLEGKLREFQEMHARAADHDKRVWQQSMEHFQKQQTQKESAWEEEKNRYDRVVDKLQQDLAILQNRLAQQEKTPASPAFAAPSAPPPELIETTVETLEGQISVINELIKQMGSASITNGLAARLRRRSDLVEINDPTRVFR